MRKDGAHVWAERYDRAIEDIFTIQDEITLILATETQEDLLAWIRGEEACGADRAIKRLS